MDRSALRRIGVTVLMALLVATAGCSGLTGGDGNGDGTADGDGDGYGVAGDELNGSELTQATQSAVEESSSYTFEFSSEVSSEAGGTERTLSTDVTTKVDFEADAGLREQVRQQGNQSETSVVYTTGDTTYRKLTTGGETTYDVQQGESDGFGGINPVNVTAYTQNYTSVVDGFEWESEGTTTIDGTTVTEYTATGVANEELLGAAPDATIENASGSLYVDSDGVVREVTISYRVSGQSGDSSVTGTLTLSDIGSTSVAEPDWLSEAQS